jgi:lipopolysaccharide assembly outer membrane protein LptD (OstA)
MIVRLTSLCCLLSIVLASACGSAFALDSGLFGGKMGGIKNVTAPKGCKLGILDKGATYNYTAPAKNFEEPIHLQMEEKNGIQVPDILVWADQIRWHNDVQSGTASGRIIVDDQKDYRVETTYVEYNQNTGQVYCPRKTKVILRKEGYDSHIIADSAILNLDNDGFQSVSFGPIEEMKGVVPKNEKSTFKRDKDKTKGKETKEDPKKKTTQGAGSKIISMKDNRNQNRISAPAE